MKKTIALFIILITLSGCFTYVRETGKFYPRNRNLQPNHRMGINGYHLKIRYYFRQVEPIKKR